MNEDYIEKLELAMSEQDYEDEEIEERLRDIERWREEYAGYIYLVEYEKFDIVFRPVNKKEFLRIQSMDIEDTDKNEEICKLCVLYPSQEDMREMSEVYGAIYDSVAAEIFEKSLLGLDEKEKKEYVENTYKDNLKFDIQMASIVASIFPHYNLEEVDNWSLPRLIDTFTRARWVSELMHQITFGEEE